MFRSHLLRSAVYVAIVSFASSLPALAIPISTGPIGEQPSGSPTCDSESGVCACPVVSDVGTTTISSDPASFFAPVGRDGTEQLVVPLMTMLMGMATPAFPTKCKSYNTTSNSVTLDCDAKTFKKAQDEACLRAKKGLQPGQANQAVNPVLTVVGERVRKDIVNLVPLVHLMRME